MSVSSVLSTADEAFQKALEHLKSEFSKLRIGRASAALVEDINVDAYGSSQSLKNVANISIPDAKTISIKPWDKSVMAAVQKAIQDSDIGLTPNNTGESILLNIPPLTEERRKELVKVVYKMAEEAKITVRTKRQDAMSKFKSMEKENEITEDDRKGAEKKLQEKVDTVNKEIEAAAKSKDEDVMTV